MENSQDQQGTLSSQTLVNATQCSQSLLPFNIDAAAQDAVLREQVFISFLFYTFYSLSFLYINHSHCFPFFLGTCYPKYHKDPEVCMIGFVDFIILCVCDFT